MARPPTYNRTHVVQEALTLYNAGKGALLTIPVRGGSVRSTLTNELANAGIPRSAFFFRTNGTQLDLHLNSASCHRVEPLTSPILAPPPVADSPYLEVKQFVETEEKLYELLIASNEQKKNGLAAHLTFPPPTTLASEWEFFQETNGRWIFLPLT